MTPKLVACMCAAGIGATTGVVAQQQEYAEQKLESPNGPGVKVAKDCSREEGNFYQGRLWGQGKFTSWEGIVSEGQFIDGRLFGQGKVTRARSDTRWHEGMFHNGEPSGPGRFQDEYGVVANGFFHRGDLIGPAVLTFPNGGKLMGEFREGVGGIGTALAIYPDGKEETGAPRALRGKLMAYKGPAAAAAQAAAPTTQSRADKPVEPARAKPADEVNKAVNILRGILGR